MNIARYTKSFPFVLCEKFPEKESEKLSLLKWLVNHFTCQSQQEENSLIYHAIFKIFLIVKCSNTVSLISAVFLISNSFKNQPKNRKKEKCLFDILFIQQSIFVLKA